MKPKTYLFPGTVNNWRADVPITEKIVWKAVAEAAKDAGVSKHVSPHTLPTQLRHRYELFFCSPRLHGRLGSFELSRWRLRRMR